MHRRDLLLNEMGISQWVLTKPQVLKGDAQIRLDKKIKLVVISEEDYQATTLFTDVLRSLNLKKTDYQWVDVEQSQRLIFEHSPLIWLIQEQAIEIEQKFINLTLWKTEKWQDLTKSIQKRQLWQQIEPISQMLGE